MEDNYSDREWNLVTSLAEELKKFDGVESTDTWRHDCATYDKLYVFGSAFNPEGTFDRLGIPDEMKKFVSEYAKERGFEVYAYSAVYNEDYDEWKKTHKPPEDPSRRYGINKRTKYYKSLVEEYNNKMKEWSKLVDTMPTRYKKGQFTIMFARLGYTAEVVDFYRGTTYWGD